MKERFDINRGEHKSLMLAEEIIAEAKSRFPVSVCVKGLLTEEEREKIEADGTDIGTRRVYNERCF